MTQLYKVIAERQEKDILKVLAILENLKRETSNICALSYAQIKTNKIINMTKELQEAIWEAYDFNTKYDEED